MGANRDRHGVVADEVDRRAGTRVEQSPGGGRVGRGDGGAAEPSVVAQQVGEAQLGHLRHGELADVR